MKTTYIIKLSGLFFWSLVFLLNTGPHWEIYSTLKELLETVGLITGLQFMVAWVLMKSLVPNLLNQGRKTAFVVAVLGLVFVASEVNIVVRYWYLEVYYPDSYLRFLSLYGDMPFSQRMLSLWTMKYIFFTKLPLFLYPGVILVAYDFHQKQQDLLMLSEQKKTAELNALKNQLNPHFIFNTLNNLYALALKKSDQTPVVIEKLSDILDYMLYRCNDQFVSLKNEITLLENYMALEQLRYGKRLDIKLTHQVDQDVQIAPLLLLTLLENACKHSTSEELNTATITANLQVVDDKVVFTIHNTKPKLLDQSATKDKHSIGMDNLRKQLNLLYPEAHELLITDKERSYEVCLELPHQ